MIVTWLGHAGLFLNAAGKTLLLDPWFSEPVFGGSWFRYPPAPYPDASSLPRPDFLLLSHIHPDHSGPGTLAQFMPDTETYAMRFPSGALDRRLKRLRFSNVEWTDPWETVQLDEGLMVTFVPHDRGWEVSSIVVEADGVRLYHGNDNPLSVEAYKEIVKRLGPIDIAFLPYAGASSYPTGFGGTAEVMKERCEKKKKEGLARFTDGIMGLKPKEAAPFASSWALLELSEVHKNYVDRPTGDEALAHAMKLAHEQDTHLLRMNPGDEWSLETGVIDKGLSAGWDQNVESVRRYAEQEKARIEREIRAARHMTGAGVDARQLDEAMRVYVADMIAAAGKTLDGLQMNAGFVAEGAGAWSVRFSPGGKAEIRSGLVGDEDETLILHAPELWAIVAGPANWEDVWYGYRLRVTKREGAGYYRAFWEMLLNFDDVPTSERLAAKFNPAQPIANG
ncbi:MAG: MBL fold metallo-hydrolase [Archangium sp.]|nr:MBL fold metallo-hydrolase [Archangium sp.]